MLFSTNSIPQAKHMGQTLLSELINDDSFLLKLAFIQDLYKMNPQAFIATDRGYKDYKFIASCQEKGLILSDSDLRWEKQYETLVTNCDESVDYIKNLYVRRWA